MNDQLMLEIEEVRIVHGLTKQRMEELANILVHHKKTEAYRSGAQKELQQLIFLQQKLDAFIQDIDNIRRDKHE